MYAANMAIHLNNAQKLRTNMPYVRSPGTIQGRVDQFGEASLMPGEDLDKWYLST